MARLVRLDAIRTAIRRRADIRSIVRWSDLILNDMVNEAMGEWQDLILQHNPDWRLRSSLFSIVQDQQQYNISADVLAVDYYKARGVDILDSQSYWKELRPFPWGDRNRYQDRTTERSGLRYAIQENSLWLDAPPGWAETNGARLWYWPVLDALAADGDTVDDHNGWSKWLVLRVAIEVVTADRRDITALAAQLGKVEQSISASSTTRDVGHCKTVRNVRRYLGRPSDNLPRP